MKSGKLLLSVISGAVAGAAAGILFAPKKGSETRKAISETSEEYVNSAKGSLNGIKSSIDHKLEALKAKKKSAFAGSTQEKMVNDAKAAYHEKAV